MVKTFFSTLLKIFLMMLLTSVKSQTDWDFNFDISCDRECIEAVKENDCCPDNICRKDSLGIEIVQTSTMFFVIQKCPPGVDDNVNTLCEDADVTSASDLTTVIPVTSQTTTFFNKHCAACYNVTDYVMWPVNISCASYVDFQTLQSKKDIINLAIVTPYCSVTVQPPNFVQMEMCMSFPGSRFDFDGEYFDLGVSDDISYFSGQHRKGGGSRNVQPKMESPLSIILNFNEDTPENIDDTLVKGDNSSCLSTQWDHNMTDTCFDVHCSTGKQLVEDRCVSVIADGKGSLYRIPLTLLSISSFKGYDCDIKACSEDLMLTIARQLGTEAFRCSTSSRFLVDEAAVEINKDDVVVEPSKFLEVSFIYDVIVTQTIKRDRFEELALDIMNQTWNLACGESTVDLKYIHQNEIIDTLAIPFPPEIHEHIPFVYRSYSEGEDFITISPFLVCRFVMFNSSQYDLDNATGGINIDDGRVHLLVDEHDITDNGDARVCVETLNMKYDSLVLETETTGRTVYSINQDIKMYLSYVCITLSLLGLLLTFIIYMIFPSLRSLPAKNNICLVFNLFWAQLLLQFGIQLTDDQIICKTIGVLIHFFWLSAILSMNVCSYHMYSVFSSHKMAILPKHSSAKRLVKYIAYCYTLSALIVMTTATSQYIYTDGNSFGYGGRYCYLSSARLIGIAFALPLGVVLLLNAVMFVLAVRSIAQTSQIQRELMSKGRQNLHVYIKLSTLTGLFWIVGILAEAFEVEALTYMSIILNGSQGVFIFVACTCNKRVLGLVLAAKKTSSRTSTSDKSKTTRTKSTSVNETK